MSDYFSATPGAAMNENTIKLLQASAKQVNRPAKSDGAAQASEAKPEPQGLTQKKMAQLGTVNSFKKEVVDALSVLQVASSALQEIEEGLSANSNEQLNKAADKASQLLESVKRNLTDRELAEVKANLAKNENVSFADVVEAVAVVAKASKSGGAQGTDFTDLREAVSLVNQALSKAQVRVASLSDSVSAVGEKANASLKTAEGLEALAKKVNADFASNRDSAIQAQANIDASFVSRLLQQNK
ncbi:MAG: hypothetical protein R3194_08800 [Limnobacter sp.]|nr:hypothetical protein [Limnobacter sp.]